MSIETEVNTETKRMSVSFTRKVGDNNYGSTEVRAWFEQEIPEGADQSAISQELSDMVNTAKAAVLDQLGVEVHDFTPVNNSPEYFYDSDHLNQEGTQRKEGFRPCETLTTGRPTLFWLSMTNNFSRT